MIQIKKIWGHLLKKMTELKQFLIQQADFSDIRDFSKIAVFMDFGCHFKIPAMGTIFRSET